MPTPYDFVLKDPCDACGGTVAVEIYLEPHQYYPERKTPIIDHGVCEYCGKVTIMSQDNLSDVLRQPNSYLVHRDDLKEKPQGINWIGRK